MRAVIYARVSTDKQKESSVDEQVRRCRQYCELRNYEVIEIFAENPEGNTSGMKLDRPEYTRMMDMIEEWDIAVAYKLDRFHRNSSNAAAWATTLNNGGKNFAALDIDIDTSTAMGMGIFKIMTVLNEMEVDITRERTRMGMEARKHEGAKIGKPPLGYLSKFKRTGQDADKGILEVCPSEADTVRFIFDCKEKGLGLSETAESLTEAGIKTRTGKSIWKPSVIGGILEREGFYQGTYMDLDGVTKEYSWEAIL